MRNPLPVAMLVRPHRKKFRVFSGKANKGTFSLSVRNLEAKGLIAVYRTRGGQAESVWLTSEGKNRAANLGEVWIKE